MTLLCDVMLCCCCGCGLHLEPPVASLLALSSWLLPSFPPPSSPFRGFGFGPGLPWPALPCLALPCLETRARPCASPSTLSTQHAALSPLTPLSSAHYYSRDPPSKHHTWYGPPTLPEGVTMMGKGGRQQQGTHASLVQTDTANPAAATVPTSLQETTHPSPDA